MTDEQGYPLEPLAPSEAAPAETALEAAPAEKPKTLDADRKYSDGDTLVGALTSLSVATHFVVRDDRPKAMARLYENELGYPISLKKRMRIG